MDKLTRMEHSLTMVFFIPFVFVDIIYPYDEKKHGNGNSIHATLHLLALPIQIVFWVVFFIPLFTLVLINRYRSKSN